MSRHSENAIHALLRRGGTLNELQDLITQAGDEAVNLVCHKNNDGLTPLMLAAQSVNVEACRFLLEHGADRVALAHSKTRRTASMYALEHGNAELARELQSVEAAQLSRLAVAEPGAAASRCSICGGRMGRVSKFQTMFHAVHSGEETNALAKTLRDAAEAYQRQLEQKLDSFLGMLEPASTVLVGGIVGFIAFSMFVPIYSGMKALG